MKKKIIAFPQIGNYKVPIKYLLEHIFHVRVMLPARITNRTIELGEKYSPKYVCMPFKYTLGTFIENLECGANLLLQAGSGCEYGYYGELQTEILKSLGYEFELIQFVGVGKMKIKRMYQFVKKIDSNFQIRRFLKYARITKKMIFYMEQLEDKIRENIGFEVVKGSFEALEKEFLKRIKKTKSMRELKQIYQDILRKFSKIEVDKKVRYKVGVIGELYTLMEPFANYDLEKILARYHIEVKRFVNVNYLLFQKKKYLKHILRSAKKYVKYKMGGNASENIAWAKELCENGYDGIIHIKSKFCTPEIGAMAIIRKVCNDYQVPVIFFNFDRSMSVVGIETRLDAFYDMIKKT